MRLLILRGQHRHLGVGDKGYELNIPDPKGTTTEKIEGIGTLRRVDKEPFETPTTTAEDITPVEDVETVIEATDEETAPEVPTLGQENKHRQI